MTLSRPLARMAVRAGIIAVLVLAYVGAEWISEVHEHKGLPVTAWNPGLGLLFAAMLYAPGLTALALAIGIVLAEVLVVESVLDRATIIGLGVLAGGCFALPVVHARRQGIDPALARLRDVMLLFLAGGAGATLYSALASVLLMAEGAMEWGDIADASVPLLIGDGIGIAVITPLTLRLFAYRHGASSPAPADAVGLAASLLVVVVLVWVILHGGDAAAPVHLYVLVLPIVVAALRMGLDGACLALGVAQVALIIVMHLYGFGAAAFAATQAEMVVLTATGVLVGVIVSERNVATALAAAARARLAGLEQAALRADRLTLASAMSSALSHEINQPMTAARALARAAALRLAGDGPPDMPRLRENIQGVVGNIDRVTDILARMRAFIAHGGPERAPTDVAEIVEDTMALARPRAERAGIRVDVDLPTSLPPLPCDSVQVQQVLLNLIGNAIDAHSAMSPPPQVGVIAVSVAWHRAAGRIEFSVRDNGPGMPADLAERVFAPLVSVKADGLGLGLSICALIVESHGGRIWLNAHDPGATEFRFWLPLNPS